MTFVMLLTYQLTGDGKYKEPLTKSVEAVYAGSDLKTTADNATDYIKKKQPVLTKILPTAYAIGIKKQVSFTTSKITLVPNTITTYSYSNKTASINVTWRF